MDKTLQTFSDLLGLSSININDLIFRILISFGIILVGVLLGKAINFGLKRLSKTLELNKYTRGSFIDLFLLVIQWSIYLMFINLGLTFVKIPMLTRLFGRILITIPAFTGALIILTIGFALAIYLREVIEDSEVTGWDLISRVFFYFVIYIFGVYALNTALISFSESTNNFIILILTAVIASTSAYVIAKKGGKIEHIRDMRN